MGKIFISYAHEDESWKDLLKKHLAGLELDGLCDLWDDRRIETGQEWRKEIETALNSADIAVMLITAAFLASKFIRSVELPRMLERRRNEGLKVFPVIVKPCSWKRIKWLSNLQAFPKDGEPLSKMSEPDIEDNLSKLADMVHDALQGCPAEEPKSVPAGITILLTNPPKRKINFLGREQELKDIKTKLAKNERVLLVQGIGGIGKTEACKRFFMDHYCEYRYAGWIDYTGSLPASLVNACKPEVIGGREHDNIEQRFAAIMKYLHSIDRPALIVLDNIGKTVQLDPELELLFNLPAHIHVLATSRLSIDGFEMFPLDVLPEAECMTLFYNFYKGEQDDEAARAVIGLCCRHTLTVELLARTAHIGKLPLKKLLAVLNEKGFNLSAAIPEKVGTFHWDAKGEKLFFDHLQTIFDLSGLDEKEKHILANLAVLPALYTPTADIQEWLGLDTKQEIAGLIEKGWLQQDIHFNIYMHPVIGEVVRQKTKPGSAACSKLIAALTRKLEVEPTDNPIAKQGYVLYADSLLRHIDEQTAAMATLANNLSSIYQ
ncbi:MAG: toll/interleukin-1 receptor domain-containing protein, partial [Candidatus Aminicenantes bacterium]|nr:toll/interleukin-1 receptor domain-containing protein [Candidatus Aminicenantes bacterium]